MCVMIICANRDALTLSKRHQFRGSARFHPPASRMALSEPLIRYEIANAAHQPISYSFTLTDA